MTKAKLKDIMIRATKTFIQAFLAVFTLDGIVFTDLEAAKSMLITTTIAALAAGISAVWNLVMELVNKYLDKLKQE